MITRIVHLSDLHFPSQDQQVADLLAAEIVKRQPHIIIVTGDLTNHPPLFGLLGRGPGVAARDWLAGIAKQLNERSQADADVEMVVLTGNHDALAFGVSGWCWPMLFGFRSLFRRWHGDLVRFDADRNLTLLMLDTNPRWAFFSAEGKAFGGRLKRLRRAIDTHPSAAQIRVSTKVLLMHHHPLPVPFKGRDFLLHTRRVDRLLRFVAENKIDLILHGHKHCATWSHLRVGGTTTDPFLVESVGAGSAMKKDDHDPRGHNFNLIHISPGGARRVRQFFKQPEEDAFGEHTASKAEELFSRLVRAQFRQAYRIKRLTWKVTADQEGDSCNEFTYGGLVFNRAGLPYEILLPHAVEAAGGQACAGGPELQVQPAGFPVTLLRRQFGDREDTFLSMTRQPMDADALECTYAMYAQNVFAMDRGEAAERGLAVTDRDYMDFLLEEAVEELCIAAEFPPSFGFNDVRLEVLEPFDDAEVVHEPLTTSYGSGITVSGSSLSVLLKDPPPNYRYRVTWALPAPSVVPGRTAGQARRTLFESVFLRLADNIASPAKIARSSPEFTTLSAIIDTLADLSSALERLIIARNQFSANSVVIDRAAIDLSLMVCDRSGAAPKLRLVFWNMIDQYMETFAGLRLGIGEGNAGRAYKTRTLRLFDRDTPGDPKVRSYVKRGDIEHRLVLSVPLLDPFSQLPLAVLNVGTNDGPQADMFRSLTTADFTSLTADLRGQPLVRLAEAAGLLIATAPPAAGGPV